MSCSTSISPKRHFLHTADYGISLLFSLLGRCNILYGPKYKYIVLRGRSAIAVVTRSSSRRLRHDRCAVIGLKIGPSDPDPTAVLSSSFPSSFPTLSMSSSLLYYFVIAPYVSSQQRKKIIVTFLLSVCNKLLFNFDKLMILQYFAILKFHQSVLPYIWIENNSILSRTHVARSSEPHLARFFYIDL